MKSRIWELDAFRGLCVLGMVAVHFVYDLVDLYGLVDWQYPPLFALIKDWGGILFLLISGICVTLGSKPVRRGIVVFACGMLCTAVTAGMYLLHLTDKSIIIYFGVLHCLGVCMLLWPLFRRCPVWLLAVLGGVMAALGLYLRQAGVVEFPWLLFLGLRYRGFASSDYFPLLPNLGFFLLGAVLGQTVYRNKQTLLPQISVQNPAVRFLSLCGKQSLWIYLLHQPVLSLLLGCIALLK